MGGSVIFNVDIRTDNAAFEDDRDELSRILRELADKLEASTNPTEFDGMKLLDANGNTVGFVQQLVSA